MWKIDFFLLRTPTVLIRNLRNLYRDAARTLESHKYASRLIHIWIFDNLLLFQAIS